MRSVPPRPVRRRQEAAGPIGRVLRVYAGPMGRLLLAGACLVVILVACGCGSSGSGGRGADASVDQSADANDEGSADSAMTADTGVDGYDSGSPVSDDSGSEAGQDAADEGDGAIPPLMCTGDMYEPNDTEVTAYPLGTIDECDTSGSTLGAVASGMGDVDWYEYSGTSTLTCTADPTVTVDATGLEACIFVICAEGTTTLSSCTNGSPATSAAGTPGCCTTGTASMTAQMSCSSTTNDANVYMRVTQPSSDTCIPYDLAYHF